MSSHNGASAKRQDDDVIQTHATEQGKNEIAEWSEKFGVSKPPNKLASPPPVEGDHLNFFNRLYQDLPIISKPLDLTTKVYEVIKNSNCLSTCVLNAAERTVGCLTSTANEKITYIVNPKFIKDVDNGLCATLNYVEDKVPCIKYPPLKMFLYVCTGRCALNCVCQSIECSVETANKIISLLLCKKETLSAVKALKHEVLPTRT